MSSPESSSNRLNLFKFVSKRKHSSSSNKSQHSQDPRGHVAQLSPSPSQNASESDALQQQQLSDIDTTERDDSYPPEPFRIQDGEVFSSPMVHSPSESSMIFERSVEDPAPLLKNCPRCGSKSSNGQLQCNHQSIVNLPSHYSMENFVSPCLDASTKILTDDSTNLDNVDMVYSRRPSTTLGLEMALGRTRSYSNNNSMSTSPTSPSQRTQSFANIRDLDSNPTRPPVLSFYSYADVINNESPNPRRPSISQSLSSSFINSPRSGSISRSNFGNSITPQRNPSRQSFSSPFIQQQQQRIPRDANKFSLNPDNSPNSSDSESDYNPLVARKSISSKHSISSKKSAQSSRRRSQLSNINTNISPLDRTLSNQSSVVSGQTNGSGRRFSSTLDDVSDSESFVVSSIGDQLRRNTGEIKSN